MELIVYVAWLLTVLPFVRGQLHNVTVDDTDPSVTWVGNWSQTLPGFGAAQNGTYKTAKNDPDAYAEFKFTGIAVYFVSARWPYEVTTRITLDPESSNAQPLLVNLADYSSRSTEEKFGQAVLLAGASDLDYKEHTVRVDVGENATYAVFDAFVYTTLGPSDIPPNPPTSASSTAPAFTLLPEALIAPLPSHSPSAVPSQTPTPKKKLNLAVILAPICTVAGLGAIFAAFLLCRFKKQSKLSSVEDNEASSIDEKLEETTPPATLPELHRT